MEKKLVISVIVPVYNGEKFIRRAVESVLNQMDGQIELILVDDGSTDTSGVICDEYADKYPDIHVIHKPNGGTSSAKNMGIGIAKGMYLTFFDCDDFIDPGAFAQIIPVLLEHEPDCLDFGWRYVNSKGETSDMSHQCRKNVLLSLQEIESVILPPLLNLRKDDEHFIFDFCWNKMFKVKIIHNFQVRFDEEKRTWEDRTFLLRHLKHCQNYYAMDRCLYNYVFTPNSLSQRYTSDFFRIILENFNCYRELFGDRFDFDSQYANDYRVRAISNMIACSLEQTENREIIQSYILDTLKNEQVICWFTKSKPDNSFDQKVRLAVISGEVEKVLEYYRKNAARSHRQQFVLKFRNRIKQRIKKVLGR